MPAPMSKALSLIELMQQMQQGPAMAMNQPPPPPEMAPHSPMGRSSISVSQSSRQPSTPPTQKLDYAALMDDGFAKGVQQQNAETDRINKERERLAGQEMSFADVNLKPLLAFGDSMAGTNAAASYTAPTGAQDRSKRVQQLQEAVSKNQGSLRDDQLAYLKTKADEQSSFRRDAKMVAALRTPGQDAADRAFGQEYSAWNLEGGYATAETQVQKLLEAAKELELDSSLTAGAGSTLPDGIRQYTNPKAEALQQKVHSAIQNTLKLNLGGQFTEKEGTNVLKRAFNKALPASDNIAMIKSIASEIAQRAKAKEDASRHFRDNRGSMAGFTPSNIGDGKITVSNGAESLQIDKADLANAEKDGFKRVN